MVLVDEKCLDIDKFFTEKSWRHLLSHIMLMKYQIRNYHHLGNILVFLGIDLIQEKYVKGT